MVQVPTLAKETVPPLLLLGIKEKALSLFLTVQMVGVELANTIALPDNPPVALKLAALPTVPVKAGVNVTI